MEFLVRTPHDHEPRPIIRLLDIEASHLITLPDIGAVQRMTANPGETGQITRLDHHITLHRTGAPLLHSWHECQALASMTMRKGLVHVRPAGVTHRSAWTARCSFTVIALSTHFIDRCAAELFRRDVSRATLRPSIGGDDPFLWQLGTKLDELAQHADGSQVFMEEIATTMAMHLLLEAGRQPAPAAVRALPRAAVRKVSEYVDAPLPDALRLSDLAALCDISPFHFARQFKLETGFSPGRFIRMRRMQEASRLLSGSRLGIDDITAAVGYQDPSAFRRAFIRETGTTPAQFRRSRTH